jgi:uncharacterized Zn finger protein
MQSTFKTQNFSNKPHWSDRWIERLTELGLDAQLRRGRSYARRGRVQWIEVQIGQIVAQLEDRTQDHCDVEILVNPLTDEEWNRVLETLSSQALFSAQLLTGDMPQEIEQIFEIAGVSLLPTGAHDMESHCSCCEDWEQPCKHASAIYYSLGQMLDDDPWLLLRLRGRDRQQLIQALRHRRSEHNGSASALDLQATHAEPHASVPDTEPLVVEDIDEYWGSSKKLEQLRHSISAPAINLVLLRRLGHPPFLEKSIETYQQLMDIYETVTREALSLAFAADPEEDENGDDENGDKNYQAGNGRYQGNGSRASRS